MEVLYAFGGLIVLVLVADFFDWKKFPREWWFDEDGGGNDDHSDFIALPGNRRGVWHKVRNLKHPDKLSGVLSGT